jgi:hypothetical protein
MTVLRINRPLIGKAHTLGHTQIDSDHFAIADWWMKATLCAPVALPFHIAALRKTMRAHFSREAALVEAAGTPFCHCHRREHDVMLELCDDAYELSARNRAPPAHWYATGCRGRCAIISTAWTRSRF